MQRSSKERNLIDEHHDPLAYGRLHRAISQGHEQPPLLFLLKRPPVEKRVQRGPSLLEILHAAT